MFSPLSDTDNSKLGGGHQPAYLLDTNGTYPRGNQSNIYNVQSTPKNQPIHERFNAEYAQKGIKAQPLGVANQKNKTRNVQSEPVHSVEQDTQAVPPRSLPKLRRKKPSLATKAMAKLRVTSLNTVIMSTGMSFWLIVQLPLAILSTVLFGMTAAVYSFISYAPEPDPLDGALTILVNFTAGSIISGLSALGSLVAKISIDLFGFNVLSVFDPLNLFMITYVILLALAIIQLFTMYLAYTFFLLKPLGGRGAGMKKGALLLTFVGYTLPIVNIFPWFAVWAAAVWFKPK